MMGGIFIPSLKIYPAMRGRVLAIHIHKLFAVYILLLACSQTSGANMAGILWVKNPRAVISFKNAIK